MAPRDDRPDSLDPAQLVRVQDELHRLRADLVAAEAAGIEAIEAAHPTHRRSAVNLVHYVELRNHDVRELQSRLASLGLSSLGRSESDVARAIDALLVILSTLIGSTPLPPKSGEQFPTGQDVLIANADRLLGPAPTTRRTRIMVTMPSEAAYDAAVVTGLFDNGMDIGRVNCAHDDADAWMRMIVHLRGSVAADGRRCRVTMDLAGPKLRTGPLQPGPRVARIAPKRDRLGRVVTPAALWLASPVASTDPDPTRIGIVTIPVVDGSWIGRRRVGDRLELVDSRGAQRHWEVVGLGADGCLVSAEQTTYLTTGSRISCPTGNGDDTVVIGELPEVELAHRVLLGDTVILTRSLAPAMATIGRTPHSIGCSLSEAFVQAKTGEHVGLDDGKIGCVIDRVTADEITMTVTVVRPGGAKLRAGKGINLPETDLRLDALTAKDLHDLEFVARNADIVELSFVRQPTDVEQLQHELLRLDASHVGIVLKIENVAAFENLPELLLTAMRSRDVGVMIARGDLAVEVGFDRLAEVQEEIMWLCEAARVPVIWATQVLDTLARTGQPSRAEITDAAMSERAECVMLNKGPHIAEAVTVLDSILVRMQDHHDKKRSLLRRLRAWNHDTTWTDD